MENLIVGLGGHIDHGKTSLIKALNGFDGDETSQEKTRGITLDLSFSSLNLGSRNIAFIDVPGHEKLVKNMIAGAFGIDILLLVIAADDGIMPQSIEHLKIANFLGIKSCLCVITKCDKVESTRIKNLKNDIKNLFATLEIALFDILESCLNNTAKIEKIKNALAQIPKPPKSKLATILYYADRAFSIKGAGAVLTGSLLGGSISPKDKLLIYDLNREVVVKNIQIHDADAPLAEQGQRVALNIAGVEAKEVHRGMLLSKKGHLRGFSVLDVVLESFESFRDFSADSNLDSTQDSTQDSASNFAPTNLIHNANYQLFIGSKKSNATLKILKQKNKKILATLNCDTQIFGIFKQRFILRDGLKSVAGGTILNPIADPMKKSQKIEFLEHLEKQDFAAAFSILLSIHKKGFGLISSIQRFNLPHTEALKIAQNLSDAFVDSDALVLYPKRAIEEAKTAILDITAKNKNALLSAQSVNQKIKWASINLLETALNELVAEQLLAKKESFFVAKNFGLKDINEFLSQKILSIIEEANLTPEAPYNIYDSLDIPRNIGDSIFKNLCANNKIVRLEKNVFVGAKNLSAMLAKMREIIKTYGKIDINILRQHFPLSRKYLTAYLDYLDQFSDIYKRDDARFLK